jgi:hypothetical protein
MTLQHKERTQAHDTNVQLDSTTTLARRAGGSSKTVREKCLTSP